MKEEIEESGAEQELSGTESGPDSGGTAPKKRRFGRGIYEKTDVPIRYLDRLIGGIIAVIVLMIIVFALNGGYTVSFDTKGGTAQIEPQKLRYGNFVKEPETPVKPGYAFAGWYYEENPDITWNFTQNKVGGDLTLTAIWKPAKIAVKFDPDGGSLGDSPASMQATYQEKYGELPVPVLEGKTFDGWEYGGEKITADSTVMMPGEHVLTAVWK